MTDPERKPGRLMSRGQIAAELRVSERTLRRHLAGMVGLTCYQFGRRIRFDEYDVVAIKERLRVPYPTVTASAPILRTSMPGAVLRAKDNPQEATRSLMRKVSEKAVT